MAFAAVAFLAGSTGCSSDDEDDDGWVFDYTPVIVFFEIEDTEGNSLIGENGDLYGKDFMVVYNEQEFPAKWDADAGIYGSSYPESRFYLAYLHGLVYEPASERGGPYLEFGELDGGYCEADIKLVMPDGDTHELTISRHVQFIPKKQDFSCRQKVQLDGAVIDELTDGSPYMFVKIVVE